MSILFLFIKSLKRINSLYAIAWISYEQDWYLFNYYSNKNENATNQHNEYESEDYKYDISKTMILGDNTQPSICGKNKKSQIFKKDIKKLIQKYDQFLNKDFFKSIRNAIMHFDVFKKNNINFANYNKAPKKINYFDIYHYFFQSNFINDGCNKGNNWNFYQKWSGNNFPNNNHEKNGYIKITEYSKDFIKIMNLPFAYCIARYKLLTNEQIFNRLEQFGKNKNK